MNRLLRLAVLMIFIFSILMIAVNLYQGVELQHLEAENAKFKQEIEHLKGSNDLLQEDNQEFQDALWHWNQQMIKEGAE